MRHHLTPVRMAIIKTTRNVLVRMWRKGTLVHCWWESKFVQPLWKIIWRVLKKLKIELPYGPVIPLLGIYPNETELLSGKDICTAMFTTALFTIANT